MMDPDPIAGLLGTDPAEMMAAIKAEKERRANGGAVEVAKPLQLTAELLAEMGGTPSLEFNKEVATQALGSAWNGNSDSSGQAERAVATTDGLRAIAPTDAIEGMLAAQMIATHNATMECFRRAMIPSQTHVGRETNLMHANRLTRSFATLVHAIDKHRGKGQQTVRVEHVHVHEGGQAIVGNVTHEARRRDEEVAGETVAARGRSGNVD